MTWDWRYDFGYGQTQRGDSGFLKTVDQALVETQLARHVGLLVDPYISASARTQMSDNLEGATGLWNPGLTVFGAGLGKEFGGGVMSVRGGLSAQQRWLKSDRETTTGAELRARLAVPLSEQAKLTSDMRAFRAKGQDQWVIRNDAILRVQINKVMTINISAQVLQDRKQSDEWQIRQVTGFGLGWKW